MTTNAILFPSQESQTYGKRDDFECVRFDLRRAPAGPIVRAVPDMERSDV